jgi:hypothetical protein
MRRNPISAVGSMGMFLSIATTCRPATDLGYLLHKHPERLHETELGFASGLSLVVSALLRSA